MAKTATVTATATTIPAPPAPHGSAAPGATATALATALAEAVALLRAERINEAEPALQAILQRWPGQADAQHFLGVLRHTQGRTDEAVDLIGQALASQPANGGAWNNLGNVLLSAGRLDAAVQAYERGVAIAEAAGQQAAADALNNLGTLHRKQGRLAESASACRRALALRPEFADAWYNLSHTLMAQGQVHEGLLANSRAVALWPQHLQARDQVIRALLLLGERERAAGLYQEWLAEEPDNPVVQHQLAACLGQATQPAPERASDAYVQAVFDQFAASFDVKLEMLHYRAPQLVADALARAVGTPQAALQIVDAGCGTGLCGPLVKPFARQLAGCDLSEGMLRRAHGRQVYNTLHQAELVHYLHTQPAAFDVVVSADTLCYFGTLGGALAAARRSLRTGGWLIFTVEALPDDSPDAHRLQPHGRYAHAAPYLRQALADGGWAPPELQAVSLRLEAGQPVHGWLVVVQAVDPGEASA